MQPAADPTERRSERLAAEWVGKARATRQEYIGQALIVGAQMRRIVSTMEATYKGKSTNAPRRMLERAAEAWGKISKDGSLVQEINLQRRSLRIVDLRVTGSIARQADWTNEEIGLCLVGNTIDAGPKRMGWQAPLLAGLSLHSVARWYQRALKTSKDALEHDLLVLADAVPAAVAERQIDVVVETGNGGAWRCHLASDAEHLFLDTRSFY